MANPTDTETKPTGWTLDAPPAKTLVRCARHKDADATLRCDLCKTPWCRLCVVVGDERGIVWRRCQCGGRCETIVVDPEPPSAQDFGAELIDALRFPLKGAARTQAIFGACSFGVLAWVSHFTPLVGPLLAGYLFAYVELVISWTVKGKDEPPGFPDFVTIGESMFAPLLRLLLLAVIAFGPGALLFAFAPGFLGTLALLAGVAYFPMALLAVVVVDSWEGFDPRRVLASIRLVPMPYAFAAILFSLVSALILGCGFAPIDLPAVGPWLRGALIFGLATIAGRVLGLIYRRFAKQLAWV